jgi:hypothetical protein
MATPSSFHLFPQLPSELRLKVWNLALSVPRVVSVTCQRERPHGTRRFVKSFLSKTGVPPILHACRESRLEGFLTYKPMFKTDSSPNYTYISFENDTITCADSILEYMGDDELERIQRMILDVKDEAYFCHFHVESLMRMRMLTELELLVTGEKISWYRGRRHLDGLIGDLEQTRIQNPTWVCPHVVILQKITGEELSDIPGGARPPGEVEDVAEQMS